MEIGILFISGFVIFLLWKIDSIKKVDLIKKDEYVNELTKHPDLYQSFFEKIVGVANSEVWASLILNPKFLTSDKNVVIMKKEEDKIGKIYKEATNKGLNETVLIILYLQYATSDPLFDQGRRESEWVSVVINRQEIDSFPDHNAIARYLQKIDYLEK